MIKIGDLVEWTEADKGEGYIVRFKRVGFVFKKKFECLDGINKTEMLKVHFPNRQQYWIVSDNLNKISQLQSLAF